MSYNPNNTLTNSNTQDPVAVKQADHQALLRSVFKTISHFFGPIRPLFDVGGDPRQQAKIDYPLSAMMFAGVLMFLCRLDSRRQVASKLRDQGSVANFRSIFGVEDFPHGDTLNDLFCELDPNLVQELICWMVETLIRLKVLYRYRVFGKFWVIMMDGTGTLTFAERHCPHCLTRTVNGKTTYYHPVLEAKLVTRDGLVLSIMTEFIENPSPNPTKQDCELKAFYRLAERLKERFPRLPILLTLDGLFACGPVFQLCRDCGWSYMVVLKQDALPTVNDEFEQLSKLQPKNRLEFVTGENKEVTRQYRWVTGIYYVDSDKRVHYLNVIECLETRPDKNGVLKTTRFKWITEVEVTAKNVDELATDGGRVRWKIENEGFNVQKNLGYHLEHAYSRNPNAAKIFYLLLQIAHIIFQLIDKGGSLRKKIRRVWGSAKELAQLILEAWRNTVISQLMLSQIEEERIQIRLDSS